MITKLPSISVIIPSLNQGKYIEQTIRSVLEQNYPDLEMIVIDGGSSDQTLDLIKKYESQVRWISEVDNGQASAINKGLRLAGGEIVTYLNSDDYYLSGSLYKVGEYFRDHVGAFWLTGYCRNVDQKGGEIRRWIKKYKNFWLSLKSFEVLKVLNFVSQPATFWRKSVLNEIGFLDESLHYTMDYDFWLRIGRFYPLHVLKHDLACFRIYPSSKSGSTSFKQFDEEMQVAGRYSKGTLQILHHFHCLLSVSIYEKLRSDCQPRFG